MSTWTLAQVQTFLQATSSDEFSALYRLALAVGLRRGELLALRWRDVDLRDGRLKVQHTMTDAGELSDPKTSGSRRAIELPPGAVAALRTHKAKLDARGQKSSPWVFPDEEGVPHRALKLSRAFRLAISNTNAKLKDDAQLPQIRFHDLRHTAATLMLELRIHPKVVSEALGHASIQITLDLYSHVSNTMQREAADLMETIFGSVVPIRVPTVVGTTNDEV